MPITRFRPSSLGTRIIAFAGLAVVLFLETSGRPTLAQQTPPETPAVTYAKDIAPILQRNCQQCHQTGAVGPMSLTTYDEVRPWARSIKQKVVLGEMPPYRYDRGIGIQNLKYDLRLVDAEIQTISRWVDAGSPAGNPADLPPARSFPDPDKWDFEDQLGPPDLIIRSKPFTLEAKGQDVWWRPVVPTGTTQNRCIKAIAVKPSVKGRTAAHHANTDLIVFDENTGEYVQGERFTEYAMGKVGETVPPDACRTLPANSLVRSPYWQDLRLYSLLMKGGELEIPPHGTAVTQGFHSFQEPVRIDSFQPHGHFRLVGKTLEIFYPETGKLELISSISNWTNSWHTSHIYEDDAAPLVPKGAVLVITGYYDNTAANKQNPDPNQWVGIGSRTADEMSHAWIAVTHLDDQGYKKLVAEREQRKKTGAQTTVAK